MPSIRIHSFSHVGNSRENQEDNFLIAKDMYLSEEAQLRAGRTRTCLSASATVRGGRFLAAVSDGMGGHCCGEVASRRTVQYLSERYDALIDCAALGESALTDAVVRLNERICCDARSQSQLRTMGATLCAVVSDGFHLFGINVGDSRLYQWSRGVLTQRSVDHTEGQRLLDLGLLSAQELRHLPHRKHLYRYIGREGQLQPDVVRIAGAIPGSLLLLCSDGLTDALTDAQIAQVINDSSADIPTKGARLVEEAARECPGQGDNITLVIIEF